MKVYLWKFLKFLIQATWKYHNCVAKTANICISQFWNLGCQRSRCWYIQCLVKALFWFADGPLLALSLHGREQDYLSLISSCTSTNPFIRALYHNLIIGRKPHLHVPSQWGIGLQHMYWEGHIHVQSIG